jgi:hypothetical protein
MVRASILSGRGGVGLQNATWNGPGINSSVAAQSDGAEFAIGYADNSALAIVGAEPFTSFFGQAVDASAILIRYVRGGDANFDGVVDDNDISIVLNHYRVADSGEWFNGDFDFDGAVDDTDISALLSTYNPNLPPLN